LSTSVPDHAAEYGMVRLTIGGAARIGGASKIIEKLARAACSDDQDIPAPRGGGRLEERR
jgi:hypothetical protein